MVALLRGHIRGGTELTGALVGILALLLPPMGWIMQLVSLLLFISLHVTLSILCEFMALHSSI
jgi:hypothetical protein